MDNWGFTLIFIFSILIMVRQLFLFVMKLFSEEPTQYVINKVDLIMLGAATSYLLTYLIY
mgnify:CR=1